MRRSLLLAATALTAAAAATSASAQIAGFDLSTYGRIGAFDLPTRAAGSLMAEEVSAINLLHDVS